MTITDYLLVLRQRWRTIAVTVVLTVVAAALVTFALPKTYAAQATSFVSISSSAPDKAAPDQLYQNSQFALNRVQSYPDILGSRDLLQSVIDDLGLPMTVAQLRGHLSATNPTGTVLLQVRATSASAREAGDIANTAARELGTMIERLESPKSSTTSPVQVSVAVPATTPAAPASPRLMLDLAAGLLLGLALGLVVAVLRDRRDTSVKSPADLEELVGAAPLGVIRNDPTIAMWPLVAATESGPTVEDFRSIRTNLRYVDVDLDAPRRLVVTSAIPGEGKSVTACNLAIVLAQSGLSVCLVEADLRRPKATKYLGIDGAVGLTEVVAGEFDLDEALVSWNRGMVTVLPAGATPPDPTSLLGSRATEVILDKLRARFDVVVLDAPPLLPVSDAVVLASVSDGVLLVTRYGHVARDQVASALKSLEAVDAHLTGTILNAAPQRTTHSYYGPDYNPEPETAPRKQTMALVYSVVQQGRAKRRVSVSGRHAARS